MSINTVQLNNLFNNVNIKEQYLNNLQNVFKRDFFKIKTNFYLKNIEKNRFLFIMNLLLLERSTGQRVTFVLNKEDTPRVKSFKIGCSVSIRSEYLFNFWKMLIFFSFPKLHDIIIKKNYKYHEQFKNYKNINKKLNENQILKKKSITFLNLNKFLFFSSFSFLNDFDRFLLYYENFLYYFSMEIYSGFHKFLLNNSILTMNGLHLL